MTTISWLLIVHALVGVALLGAITHQAVSLLYRRPAHGARFLARYAGVNTRGFTTAVISLYVAQVTLGAVIYPSYRLNVRIPFEEMSLGWAIGIFELKEHFAGIGLGMLPFYARVWSAEPGKTPSPRRLGISLTLAFIVWLDFLVGHVLNNIRGLA